MIRAHRLPPSALPAVLLVALSCTIAGAQPAGPPAQTAPAATSSAARGGSFVWLSDSHLTPFYPFSYKNKLHQEQITAMLDKLVDRSNPAAPVWRDHTQWGAVFAQATLQADAYSTRGHDANDKVLQEVLKQAAAIAPDPDFILITGDLLGHGFGWDYAQLTPSGMDNAAAYQAFVAETIKYIALSVRTRFPEPPVFATLGNNDSYCGDYDIHLDTPSSDFLADTADTFLQYFLPQLDEAAQQAFRSTFARGGYYTVPVPNGGGSRIIVLNSIPFLGKYPLDFDSGSFPATTASCHASPVIDADQQIEWLSSEAEKPGRAWIAAHVPPGNSCWSDSPFWTDDHLTSFRTLFLQDSSASHLAGTLSAHSHMATFKLLRDAGNNPVSFVLQAPSIGPNHSNNPTFGVVSHDPRTLEIQSHRIYYLDLSRTGTTWGHFQFAGLQGPVTTATLASLYDDLKASSAIWSMFVEDYGSRAGSVVGLGRLSQTHLDCLYDLTGTAPVAPPG